MKKIQNNKHKHVLFQLGTQGMAKLSLAIFYSQKISTRWVTKLASSLHIQRFFIFGNSNSTSKPVSIESDLVQSGSSQRVVSTYVEARTGLTKPNMNDKPAVSVSETQSRLVVEKGLDKGHQNDSTSRARALSRFGVFLFVAVMQHSVGSTSRARALSQLCDDIQHPSSSTSRTRA